MDRVRLTLFVSSNSAKTLRLQWILRPGGAMPIFKFKPGTSREKPARHSVIINFTVSNIPNTIALSFTSFGR